MNYKKLGECFSVAYNSLFDFVFPPFCVLCEAHLENFEHLVCIKCWLTLPALPNMVKNYFPENINHNNDWYIDVSLALWEYSEAVQHIIHLFKYERRTHLGKMIGAAMAGGILNSSEVLDSHKIIPIPLHRLKLRERGYNQSRILANTITHMIQIPLEDRAIQRVRYTNTQAALNKRERAINVKNAFCLNTGKTFEGQSIILVDDLYTTGATANECAKLLKKAGAAHIYVVTSARA